ncbi:uncharacterized protein [Musca autumnalis]|uniref:uncharacterized protein n=1 Tax=Musca autumnalis TaxID=221902 RepID=UPI003CF32FA4
MKKLNQHKCLSIVKKLKKQAKTGSQKCIVHYGKIFKETFREERLRKMRIRKNLKSGIYKYITKTDSDNPIWKLYSLITTQNGAMAEDGYVYCRKCEGIYRYIPKRCNNLRRHVCFAESGFKRQCELQNRKHINEPKCSSPLECEETKDLATKIFEQKQEEESCEEVGNIFDSSSEEENLSQTEENQERKTRSMKSRKTDKTITYSKLKSSHDKSCMDPSQVPSISPAEEMQIIRNNIKNKIANKVYKLQENSFKEILSLIVAANGRVIKDFLFCHKCKQVVEHKTSIPDSMQHECFKTLNFPGDLQNVIGGNLMVCEEEPLSFELQLIKQSVQHKLSIGQYKLMVTNNNNNLLLYPNLCHISMTYGCCVNEFVACKLCREVLPYGPGYVRQLKQHKCQVTTEDLLDMPNTNECLTETSITPLEERSFSTVAVKKELEFLDQTTKIDAMEIEELEIKLEVEQLDVKEEFLAIQ